MDYNTERLLHKQLLLSSSLRFTQGMFAYMNKTPYIVGEHHSRICKALDDVVKGKTRKLIINIAPRYGKTLLVSQMFIAYGLALNPKAKFLHLSYSGSLVQDNSMAIKDIVTSEYFNAVFGISLSKGKNAKSRWDTIEGGAVYATSTLGQITGFGAGLTDSEEKIDDEDESNKVIDEFMSEYNPDGFSGAIVIDDPLKPDEALSETVRERINLRFETTIRNRVNSRKTPIIIVMQRLHEHDLCGYLQEIEPDDWTVLSLPAISYKGGQEIALWSHKHTIEELYKIKNANSYVFETQYMQNPKPLEGLLYREFKTYDVIPIYSKAVKKNYTDTADTGSDFFCSINYEEHSDACYVTDVIYTKKTMEYTEQALAQMLSKNRTQYALIESNNGGRIFRRNVEKITREYGNLSTTFVDFTQSKNKQVRIFSYSNEVNNLIIFPKDWERRWPEFANNVKHYRKEGINQNDDAEDVLTGIVEFFGKYSVEDDKNILKNML